MKITIDVKFGSDFQEEVNTDIIMWILKAIQHQMKKSHKKNSFTYVIDNGDNTIQEHTG